MASFVVVVYLFAINCLIACPDVCADWMVYSVIGQSEVRRSTSHKPRILYVAKHEVESRPDRLF